MAQFFNNLSLDRKVDSVWEGSDRGKLLKLREASHQSTNSPPEQNVQVVPEESLKVLSPLKLETPLKEKKREENSAK